MDPLKQLFESGLFNEEVQNTITEAWESKLNETREQVKTELREEFAHKFEHDKKLMVDALDRMVSENLTKELSDFAQDRKQIAEDRVKFRKRMSEDAQKFSTFLTHKLAQEIKELREERNNFLKHHSKLDEFVLHALAKEIKEFDTDKKSIVETKVKLVKEATDKFNSLKQRFIRENTAKIKHVVSEQIKSEMNQLHEDIKIARENNFGRRIFEAFANEFSATHLNENKEIRKLNKLIKNQQQKINEAKANALKAQKLAESKEKQIRMINESNKRNQILSELISPLNKEKAKLMTSLLENVQTSRLQSAYEKYLPSVLSDNSTSKIITESKRVMTGNKPATKENDDDNIIDIKKLAGL